MTYRQFIPRLMATVALMFVLPGCRSMSTHLTESDWGDYRTLVKAYERSQIRWEDLLARQFERSQPTADHQTEILLRALIESYERGQTQNRQLLEKQLELLPPIAVYEMVADAYGRAEEGYNHALATYADIIDHLIHANDRTPPPNEPAGHVTVALEPATIDQLVGAYVRLRQLDDHQHGGTATPTPNAEGNERPRTGDLWESDAFQTLMSTLWQAPLAVLGIVLAIGAFFGWQAYTELVRTLSKRFQGEVEHTATLTIAAGHLDAAMMAWELCLELTSGHLHLTKDEIRRQIPPMPKTASGRKGLWIDAVSHLRFAKGLARLAVSAIDKIPREAEVSVRGKSKAAISLEARQSYAYYIAFDPRSKIAELELALQFSADALERLDDRNWLKTEGLSLNTKGPAWTDTYLFVRLVYANRIAQRSHRDTMSGRTERQRAILELEKARSRYEHIATDPTTYQEVINRFR